MHVTCSRCGSRLDYGSQPPRFCSHCGQQLAPAQGPPTTPLRPADDLPTRALDPSEAPRRETPAQLGGYRLLKALGSGGMGTVYEAEQPGSRRRVALKVIRPEFADSPDAVERFRREGRLAGTLSHPRCVFVLAADEEAGLPYILMELMPGRTLADAVAKDGPLPVGKAVRFALDAAEGLEEAHQAGVVHRDVKPSNCFLDDEGRVKVGDFGLAKSLLGQDALTRSGAFLGTFLFAAPEQIRNDRVDGRADVYSLCATLYFLLTGKAPFEADDPAAALARTVSDPLTPMRVHRPGLPRTLDEVVLKGLSRDRKARWQTMEELRLALLPFIEGSHSLGELAARATAYLLDFLFLLLPMLAMQLGASPWLRAFLPRPVVPLGQFLVTLVLFLAYFGLPEAQWGCSPGKWLLRLRVRVTATGDRPSQGRSLLRTAWFVMLTAGTVGLSASLFHLAEPALLAAPGVARVLVDQIRIAGLPLLTTAVGTALVACTMRRRNGYRGLHEWLSGTCVIRLPEGRPRLVLPALKRWPTHGPSPVGIPERLGAFRVLGLLWEDDSQKVLHGADQSLDRPVWLWLRRGTGFTTSQARCLAGGEQAGWTWEAFAATPGCLLADLVARERLPWRAALTMLEQLASDLRTAEAAGTLPAVLSLEQVWTQSNGRAVLLDAPARPPRDAGSPLELLGRVAALALEGRERLDSERGKPLCAPVPGHAAVLAGRLLRHGSPFASLEEAAQALAAAHDKPAEITRPGKALQLAISCALLAPGLAVLFLLGPVLLSVFLAVGAEARALAELRGDPSLSSLDRQRRVVMASYSGFLRPGLQKLEASIEAEAARQIRATEAGGHSHPGGSASSLARGLLAGWSWMALTFLAWPVAWCAVAALTGGGPALRLTGIRLLDARGRPAPWWRLALRTLVVWLPVAALLFLAVAVDAWRVAHVVEGPLAWVSWLAWWLALGLLPCYAWAAIRWPNQGPHDRFAGTYPVPE